MEHAAKRAAIAKVFRIPFMVAVYAHAMLGRMRLRTSTSFFLLALTVFPLNAKVLHVDVATRTTVLNGKEFGPAGAYERVTGSVYFSLPVANPHSHRIVDLGNAVSLKNGEVEFSSDPSIGAPDQRVAFEASYLPFPRTGAERQKTGDPRKSIAERYVYREDYLARYKAAADDLVQQRLILPEDRAALIHRGEQEWVEATR